MCCDKAEYNQLTMTIITPGILPITSGSATVGPDDKQDEMLHGDTRKERITTQSKCKQYSWKMLLSH